MSMMLMVQAMNAQVGNPLRKLILLKLADNANDQGECWPSYRYIAAQCEVSRRTVIRHIAALQTMGLVRINARIDGQGQSSNMFQLTFAGCSQVIDLSGGDRVTPGGDRGSPGGDRVTLRGGDRVTPRISHSFEPVIEPKDQHTSPKTENTVSGGVGDPLVESFESQFWQAGLPKVRKKDAIKAYRTAYKEFQAETGGTVAEFARMLTADVSERLTEGVLGFQSLHPVNYLEQRRWQDERGAPPPRRQPMVTSSREPSPRARMMIEEARAYQGQL